MKTTNKIFATTALSIAMSLGVVSAMADDDVAGVPGGEIETAYDAWVAEMNQDIIENLGTDDIRDLIGVSVATADGTIVGTIETFTQVANTVYAIIDRGEAGPDVSYELAEMAFDNDELMIGGISGEEIGDLPNLGELEEPRVDLPRD